MPDKSDLDRHIEALEKSLLNSRSGPSAEAIAKADPREVARLGALVGGLAPVIREFVANMVLPVARSVSAMEGRVAEIETRGIRYRGVWQASEVYRVGDLVTCDGGMWHACNDAPGMKPGSTGSTQVWQLTVKSPGR